MNNVSMKKSFIVLVIVAFSMLLSGCKKEINDLPQEITASDIDKNDLPEVVINEVMVKNHTSYVDEYGKYPDWIELKNLSDAEINLDGWMIGKDVLNGVSIAPNSLILISDVSLKKEAICLIDENGQIIDTIDCSNAKADMVFTRDEGSGIVESFYPTPGFENTKEGYLKYCDAQKPPCGPLIISEVCVANIDNLHIPGEKCCDWIELKNISNEDINLSNYCLSDDDKNRMLFQLPDKILPAGLSVILYCDEDLPERDSYVVVPFSLSSVNESLWVSDINGNTVDCISLHDIPINGSCGKTENAGGFFYYDVVQPGLDKQNGKRFGESEAPNASVKPGIYDDVEGIILELTGNGGPIYYTTDGQLPDCNSNLYSEPLSLDKTTVIRAITIDDNSCSSNSATYCYFINENISLPIVSMVTDSVADYNRIIGLTYGGEAIKNEEITGSVVMYDGSDEIFNKHCGIKLKGFTAVQDPIKKNYGFYFRNKYGDGPIENNDLFNSGISEYSSLVLRAGQDSHAACIRNELMQDLCLQSTKKVPTLNNIYCVFFINGEYHGVYSLKENFNEKYYANLKGTDSKFVQEYSEHYNEIESCLNVINFAIDNDMSVKENYDQFCKQFDIDNLIDCMLLEGYAGNTELHFNTKIFKASNDSKWEFYYFDLDRALYSTEGQFNAIFNGYGKYSLKLTRMMKSLVENSEFRAKMLSRYSELTKTTLTDENVLATMDRLAAEIEPEMKRDREFSGISLDYWYKCLNDIRTMLIDEDYRQCSIDTLCEALSVTSDEKEYYFD